MSGSMDFSTLYSEAISHPVRGWDFSWLTTTGRIRETAPPWNYARVAHRRARASPDLLDLGTGGGELLAEIFSPTARTVATESYAPNVPVAAQRLVPLGIHVVRTSVARDNSDQDELETSGRLPFREGSFHLVVDRNEAFVAREISRVLGTGGIFLTEQTGGGDFEEIYDALSLPVPASPSRKWGVDLATNQLNRAGLAIVDSAEARLDMEFVDVGALIWYLRAVPWAARGCFAARHRDRFEELHRRIRPGNPLRVTRTGFWLEAVKQ